MTTLNRNALIGKIGFSTILLLLAFTNCSDVSFSNKASSNKAFTNGPENPFGPECEIQQILMEDSFERSEVDDPGPNNVFGWRKIVDDQGRLVGSSGNKINAKTFCYNSKTGRICSRTPDN